MDELAGGHLCVARHVPSRTPDQGAGEGILQRAEVARRGAPGAIVQAHLGEGEVAVVDEKEIGLPHADQRGHISAGTNHIDLAAFAQNELVSDEVVEAKADAVGAQGGSDALGHGGRFLLNDDRRVGAVGIHCHEWAQQVDA